MTKKQHREEHCRLIKEFRQPRVKVELKPYSLSNYRKKLGDMIEHKQVTKIITKNYVMKQLEQSVVIDKKAPSLKELQRKNIKKEIELSKKLIRQIKEERNKPRWKFR